nr:YceI family protein [Psychroflexus torquis]
MDPTYSEIGFRVKHMMISTVTGHFEHFKSTVETETENFNDSDISFTTQTNSINTKNSDRDASLKSDDFFNAAYPELNFTFNTNLAFKCRIKSASSSLINRYKIEA